jgi:hypothetical protein
MLFPGFLMRVRMVLTVKIGVVGIHRYSRCLLILTIILSNMDW